MDVKTLEVANKLYDNVVQLKETKEELLDLKKAMSANNIINTKGICIGVRSIVMEDTWSEISTLIDNKLVDYSLYIRDIFVPGFVEFIDKQVEVLDIQIEGLKEKLKAL